MPDDDHEALRDLVRAREAAKKDQLKARHRLGKFPPAWPAAGGTEGLDEEAPGVDQESRAVCAAGAGVTLADYLEEVDHVAAQVVKLEKAIDEASNMRRLRFGQSSKLSRP